MYIKYTEIKSEVKISKFNHSFSSIANLYPQTSPLTGPVLGKEKPQAMNSSTVLLTYRTSLGIISLTVPRTPDQTWQQSMRCHLTPRHLWPKAENYNEKLRGKLLLFLQFTAQARLLCLLFLPGSLT